ncbi:MAG: hypothetical protein L0H23_07645 [Luteimonas sp.]|nr:hypothetical protein [Luteimonas sp.]
MSHSRGLLGGALVVSRRDGRQRLRATFVDGQPPPATGALSRHAAGNSMAPMLPLFEALAGDGDVVLLEAGPGRVLRVEIANG